MGLKGEKELGSREKGRDFQEVRWDMERHMCSKGAFCVQANLEPSLRPGQRINGEKWCGMIRGTVSILCIFLEIANG